jgi:hypothetical protein
MAIDLTREQLLSLFKTDLHGKIEKALDSPGSSGLSVYENPEGKRRAVPATPDPLNSDADGYLLVGTFRQLQEAPEMVSRTQNALAYLESHPEASARSTAKRFGITTSAIFNAKKRRANQDICPCCRQVIQAGFKSGQRAE